MIELDTQTPFAGRYQVVRRMAAGGMGAVFEVVHIETQRRRALKVMLPDLVTNQELRDRFQMEARVTARIDSDYIVDVFDAGIDTTTGMPFLVMELLQGEELGKILERVGAIAAQDVVTYLGQVASALDKTHAQGIVHRDLKPENLFLTHREDGTPRIKILDFGISKVINEAGTAANATRSLGTPLYMAPEQVLGQNVSVATDLYSLGLIGYTLLVGVSYWSADAARFDNAIAFVLHTTKGAPESPVVRAARLGRVLPPAFEKWFARATNLEPAQRYQRASELVSELATSLGISSLPAGGSPHAVPTFTVPHPHASPAAVSAAHGVGTAPGTEFDRQGTIPGLPRKAGTGLWLLAAGTVGAAAVAGAFMVHARGAADQSSSAKLASEGATVVPSAMPAPPVPAPTPAPIVGAESAVAKSVDSPTPPLTSAAASAVSRGVQAPETSVAAKVPSARKTAVNAKTSSPAAAEVTPPAAAAAHARVLPYTRD